MALLTNDREFINTLRSLAGLYARTADFAESYDESDSKKWAQIVGAHMSFSGTFEGQIREYLAAKSGEFSELSDQSPGALFKAYRISQGISVEELAKLLNANLATVKRWERNDYSGLTSLDADYLAERIGG